MSSKTVTNHRKKTNSLRLVLIRMFWKYGRGELCSPAGDRRSPLRIHINFGRDVAFSADLCYNGANEKPPSEREVAAEG